MTADTLRSWTVELPISEHLSSNHRRHRMHEAQVRSTIREAAGWAMRAARVPKLDRIDVRLHVVPPDKRRRDRHNYNPTLKPCLDGIVDAGIIADDTPEHVASEQIVLCEPDGSRWWRWWLTITEVEA